MSLLVAQHHIFFAERVPEDWILHEIYDLLLAETTQEYGPLGAHTVRS